MLLNFELITLQFGKYKDESIEDIFEIDPQYCKWLFTQPRIQIYPNIYKFLVSKFRESNKIYLEFGKYRGRELSEIIAKKDIKYLFILRDMPVVKYKYEYLYKTLNLILENIKIDIDKYY